MQSVNNGPSGFATYRLLCHLQNDAETVHAIYGNGIDLGGETAGPMILPPAWQARAPRPVRRAPRTRPASGGVPARGP